MPESVAKLFSLSIDKPVSEDIVPLVSIKCLVYNHEPYLRQCLDGFVMQKTNFPFEAIVHDDASTDGSAAIIREYAEKYPDIIKPIYETENQYSKRDGSLTRAIDAVMHPDSKYIAHCEGDDYWTDPDKLQLQVDFLESHPDYYMTTHEFSFLYMSDNSIVDNEFVDSLPIESFHGREYCTPSLDQFFIPPWFTQILSIVRRRYDYVDAETIRKYPAAYDYVNCYYMLKAGKCALFKDVMGVYRKQGGGVYSSRVGSVSGTERWIQAFVDNYHVMYRLEKDKRLLTMLDEYYLYTFSNNIKHGNFAKALRSLWEHMSIVPFKNSVHCVLHLFFVMLPRAASRFIWNFVKTRVLRR